METWRKRQKGMEVAELTVMAPQGTEPIFLRKMSESLWGNTESAEFWGWGSGFEFPLSCVIIDESFQPSQPLFPRPKNKKKKLRWMIAWCLSTSFCSLWKRDEQFRSCHSIMESTALGCSQHSQVSPQIPKLNVQGKWMNMQKTLRPGEPQLSKRRISNFAFSHVHFLSFQITPTVPWF